MERPSTPLAELSSHASKAVQTSVSSFVMWGQSPRLTIVVRLENAKCLPGAGTGQTLNQGWYLLLF